MYHGMGNNFFSARSCLLAAPSEAAAELVAESIGRDGHMLLQAVATYGRHLSDREG